MPRCGTLSVVFSLGMTHELALVSTFAIALAGCNQPRDLPLPVMVSRPSPDGSMRVVFEIMSPRIARCDLPQYVCRQPVSCDYQFVSSWSDWDGRLFVGITQPLQEELQVEELYCDRIDPATLSLVGRVRVPYSQVVRWVHDDVYAVGGAPPSEMGLSLYYPRPLQLWRCNPGSMRLEYELALDGEPYIIGRSLTKVAGGRLVVHVYRGLDDAAHDTEEHRAKRGILLCQLLLFDPDSRQVLAQVDTEPAEDNVLFTSPNGRLLVVGVGDQKSLEVRRADSLDVQARLRSDEISHVGRAMAVSDDGSMVVFGSERLHLWDTVADEVTILRDIVVRKESQSHTHSSSEFTLPSLEEIYRGHAPYLWSMHFLADSHVFVAVTGKGELSVWDADTKTCTHESTVAFRAR